MTVTPTVSDLLLACLAMDIYTGVVEHCIHSGRRLPMLGTRKLYTHSLATDMVGSMVLVGVVVD